MPFSVHLYHYMASKCVFSNGVYVLLSVITNKESSEKIDAYQSQKITSNHSILTSNVSVTTQYDHLSEILGI